MHPNHPPDAYNHTRRKLIGAAALALTATGLGLAARAAGDAAQGADGASPSMKQINAGLLSVGYAEYGVESGPVVILLHGWPYDIHAFDEVAPILAAAGYRVIVPYLRGYGATRFSLGGLAAQRTAVGARQRRDRPDGRAWGRERGSGRLRLGRADGLHRRSAVAASVSRARLGERIPDRQPGGRQEAAAAPGRADWWYQFYFATARGEAGYQANRRDFARLIWRTASPQWRFDEATFARSAAAFDNPDHVAIVIHNYRWRLGLAEGERRYDMLEAQLAQAPRIGVPTITLEGDANGFRIRSRPPTPACSRADTSIGSFAAGSATTFPKKRRAASPRPFLTSGPSDGGS